MKTVLGLLLVVMAAAVAISFKIFIEGPATQPMSNGQYGELYGPVIYFRYVVYALCIIQALAGVAIGRTKNADKV